MEDINKGRKNNNLPPFHFQILWCFRVSSKQQGLLGRVGSWPSSSARKSHLPGHPDLDIRHRIYRYTYIYIGELGYDKPLYDGLLSITDDMLGPIPMHIKYVYWTMRRPDSVCRNLANANQYHGTHDATYDVISYIRTVLLFLLYHQAVFSSGSDTGT